MTKYGIKEMEFCCDNNNCFEAKFTTNQGEEFLLTASSAK